ERLGAITIPSNQLFRSMDSWKIYTAEQTALVMAAPGPSHVYVTRHHSWKTQYGGLTHKQVWESAALPRPQFSCPSKKIHFEEIRPSKFSSAQRRGHRLSQRDWIGPQLCPCL
ncbi:hypothetical protein MJG53_002838, partial [Ovis ammon polii x Ovis aries]